MKSSKLKIIVIFVIAGFIYGFASAIYNQNPYYSPKGELLISKTAERHPAWLWEPSPMWIPSYLLCKMAKNSQGNWAGITYTKSGYLFSSQIERILYFAGSTVLGIAFGVVSGIGAVFIWKCCKSRTTTT